MPVQPHATHVDIDLASRLTQFRLRLRVPSRGAQLVWVPFSTGGYYDLEGQMRVSIDGGTWSEWRATQSIAPEYFREPNVLEHLIEGALGELVQTQVKLYAAELREEFTDAVVKGYILL